jgi:hypothetical protein
MSVVEIPRRLIILGGPDGIYNPNRCPCVGHIMHPHDMSATQNGRGDSCLGAGFHNRQIRWDIFVLIVF